MHLINDICKKVWKEQPSSWKASFSSSFISLVFFIVNISHVFNFVDNFTGAFSKLVCRSHFGLCYDLLPHFHYFFKIFPSFVHAVARPQNPSCLTLWEVLYVVFFTNWFTVFCPADSKCGNVFLSKSHYLCYYRHSNSGTGDSFWNNAFWNLKRLVLKIFRSCFINCSTSNAQIQNMRHL